MHDTGEQPIQHDSSDHQTIVALRVVRAVLFILLSTVSVLAVLQAAPERNADPPLGGMWLPIFIATVVFAGAVLVDIFTPKKKLMTITGVFFGLMAGLIAAVAVAILFDLIVETHFQDNETSLDRVLPVVGTAKVLIGIGLTYLGVSVVLQTQDDFRLVIPYVEFAKQVRGVRPLLLDSSALIDARIVELAQTGLMQAPLVVPRFVLLELQQLADSSDKLKRARGRRGLETVTRLQRSPLLDVTIDETAVAGMGVDQMLVERARVMPASIVTTDAGLEKVATIQGVPVINVHNVSDSVKALLVPGQSVRIEVVRQGEQKGQGVGFLEDGAMVVVEDGAGHVGQIVDLTITGSLQTSAGRMLFGRVGEERAATGHLPAPAGEATVDETALEETALDEAKGADIDDPPPVADARAAAAQSEAHARDEPAPRPKRRSGANAARNPRRS